MKQEVTVETYIERNGELVNTKDLTPDEKDRLAVWLTERLLTVRFDGKAEIHARKIKKEPA